MKSDLIELPALVRAETAGAVLVDHGAEETVWLPRSLVEIAPAGDGKSHTVTLPEWLALEKKMV